MSAAGPFDTAPDYAAPLEAWRVWRVVDEGSRISLGSTVQATVWPAGEPLVARCLRREGRFSRLRHRPQHDAPEAACQCGIYAAEPSVLRQYLAEPLGPAAVARVFGRVALWGIVVECERGFRASHAYPLEICVPADAGRRRGCDLERLVEGLGRYGVRVRLLDRRSREGLAQLEQARNP